MAMRHLRRKIMGSSSGDTEGRGMRCTCLSTSLFMAQPSLFPQPVAALTVIWVPEQRSVGACFSPIYGHNFNGLKVLKRFHITSSLSRLSQDRMSFAKLCSPEGYISGHSARFLPVPQTRLQFGRFSYHHSKGRSVAENLRPNCLPLRWKTNLMAINRLKKIIIYVGSMIRAGSFLFPVSVHISSAVLNLACWYVLNCWLAAINNDFLPHLQSPLHICFKWYVITFCGGKNGLRYASETWDGKLTFRDIHYTFF